MITEILHEYIQDRKTNEINLTIPIHQDNPDADRKFRMSDAGRCRLYRYWKREGKAIPQPDPKNALTMEAGNVLHSWVAHAIAEAGYLLESEGCLEDENRIGHFDVLLEQDGVITLADIKTVSNKKMYYMQKNGKTPDTHHVYQVMSYWHALVEEGIGDPILDDHEKIDHTIICCINRDNWHEIVEHEIERKPILISQVQDDWDTLLEAWEAQKEPTANPEPWECRFCPFAATCSSSRR